MDIDLDSEWGEDEGEYYGDGDEGDLLFDKPLPIALQRPISGVSTVGLEDYGRGGLLNPTSIGTGGSSRLKGSSAG